MTPGPDIRAAGDTLAIRARPRPVTRINRRILMLLAATGVLMVSGAAIVALHPPSLRGGAARGELYNVTSKAAPEGLAELPDSYRGLAPRLGPPLPGNIGEAIVDLEQSYGIPAAPPHAAPELPFRPDPEEDARRADRIRMARLAQQGRESGVFFQLAARQGPAGAQEPAAAALPGQLQGTRGSEAGAGPRSPAALDAEGDGGLQAHKLAFLGQEVDPDIYSPHVLQDPVSPYQLMAGTVIPAALVTGINSDLPGMVIARVTENVYDTVTGRHLLIPQGARLIGAYDSVVAVGQARALVVWSRLVMPDGSSIVIDNLPAVDPGGYAGLEDGVDLHTRRLLEGIGLSTLLGVGTELTFGDNETDLVRALREAAQGSVNQVGQRIAERSLDIPPTITIRPGWPLRVMVRKDLVLRPYRG